MENDLLLEVGCEELPSSFVATALSALPALVTRRLDALRLEHGGVRALGTPRRLAIMVDRVAERQPDMEEELTGPPAQIAFDPSGKPTKGAEAFAKKLGVDVAALRVIDTPKGRYVAGTRKETGRPAIELLPKLLVDAIAEIPFRKSMRWGAGEVAFGRPVHWIVALFGEQLIPLSFAGVASDRKTLGHRFLAPQPIVIAKPSSYVDALRAGHVLVDVDERRALMRGRLRAHADALGAEVQEDEFLEAENLGLVEEPFIVEGSFDEAFLALPERLILDVMRTHQRYFGMRGGHTHTHKGKLLPRYLAVVNTANDPDTIRKGNDRVMRARLSDARFFVETDRKAGLEACALKIAGIRYHAKLGSMADKTKRIERIASLVAERALHDVPEKKTVLEQVVRASHLCKADLASLTVGEFPEMQGYAGRDIALHAGIHPEVANAIAEHWFNPEDVGTTHAVGLFLGLADKFDHLVGGFAVGLAPSGGNDAFSMRRAFNRAVIAYLDALSRKVAGKLPSLIRIAEYAYQAYMESPSPLPKGWTELEPELAAFMKGRLVGLFDEEVDVGSTASVLEGLRAPRDVVEACIEASFDDLQDLRERIRAIRDARGTEAFARLATAFKRAAKITKDVAPAEPDPKRFDHPAERALWSAYGEARGVIESAMANADYRKAVEATSSALADPIDTFFDKDRGVFVMADDLAVRENRLRMLATIAGALRRVARLELLEGSSSGGNA
jgi:glycyl-tRNA synthetase beta chain